MEYYELASTRNVRINWKALITMFSRSLVDGIMYRHLVPLNLKLIIKSLPVQGRLREALSKFEMEDNYLRLMLTAVSQLIELGDDMIDEHEGSVVYNNDRISVTTNFIQKYHPLISWLEEFEQLFENNSDLDMVRKEIKDMFMAMSEQERGIKKIHFGDKTIGIHVITRLLCAYKNIDMTQDIEDVVNTLSEIYRICDDMFDVYKNSLLSKTSIFREQIDEYHEKIFGLMARLQFEIRYIENASLRYCFEHVSMIFQDILKQIYLVIE